LHGQVDRVDVVVVDDDPAVRDALAVTLSSAGLGVRTFGSSEEFIGAARGIAAGCVLLDLHLPSRSGLDVLEAIGGARYPAPVIMITGHGDIALAVAAIKAGAFDFLEKPFDGDFLTDRVRQALGTRSSGEAPLSLAALADLTPREMEVLRQIAGGLSNKEAGRALGISPRTVEVHRSRIMDKLGARNTADLMRIVLGGRP